jgi:D-serine deaminase-like pyridoxal phosphate-dependent protein
MSIPPLRTAGRSIESIETPALVVDLDQLDANIATIAGMCREKNVNWRPHAKCFRTPEIARRTIAAGAIGITVAKLGEAEMMAAAQIDNILIANQIVGKAKIARLIALNKNTDVTVAVDDIQNAESLAFAARACGRNQAMVIELDLGLRRAGVMPGPAFQSLVEKVAKLEGGSLRGVMGWEGQTSDLTSKTQKAHEVTKALTSLVDAAAVARKQGVEIDIVSAGGTGTAELVLAHPGITEVQIGRGVYSDVRARTKSGFNLPPSLWIHTTVTSRPNPSRIICDSGMKSMSNAFSDPELIGIGEVVEVLLSAEHAIIELAHPSAEPHIGSRLVFAVGYADTTVHLHDEMIGVRNGLIECSWPTLNRGCFK